MDMIYGEPVLYPPDLLPPAPPGSTPSADQIFDKYIQALGGAQRVGAITSYVAKGTSHLYGEVNEDPTEIYAKAPNQYTMLIHQREGDLARTWDGRNAWVMLPLTVVGEYPLNASAMEGAKLDGQLSFPTSLKQSLTNWRVAAPATLETKKTFPKNGSY